MNYVLIGVNHRTAPVEVREQFAIPEARLPEAVRTLTSCPGVEEGMIVSTCNRVEILARTTTELTGLDGFFREFYGVDPTAYRTAPLRISRPRCRPSHLPRCFQPGFDGRGRAANPGPGQGSLRHGPGCRRSEFAARCAADASVCRSQASTERNRNGDLSRVGRLGRSRPGQEDLRQPAGQERLPRRRRQDVRAGSPPSAGARSGEDLRLQPHLRSRGGAGEEI